MARHRNRRPAFAVAVCLTLMTIALAACGDMTSGELDRRIGVLESSASEAAMIAREVADDRTKTTFARVRARELAEDVQHEAEKMADATPAPDQVWRRERALDLAEQVGSSLEVLQTYPEDECRAAAAESDLEGLKNLLERLGEKS